MSPVERKLNAVMRAMTAENPDTYEAAMADIRMFMDSEKSETHVQLPSMENKVRAILTELGMPEHIKGHGYSVYAICLAVENEALIYEITRGLYPAVAQRFNTTGSRVERAIRHGIELVWSRADVELLMRYFGNTVNPNKGKPTNSEFIARVSNLVRQRVNR